MSDQTPDLAADEKVCPYCAETIKAAAVKCRFCQSDLTVEPPTTLPTVPAPEVDLVKPASGEPDAGVAVDMAPTLTVVDDEPPPSAEPAPAASGGPRALVLDRVLAALVVLCLLLSGALWFLVHRADNPHLDTAPDGQVTESSFRNATMSAASDAATQALSYSYKTFDADRKKARALMGPALVKQYDKAMDQVASQTASAKLTLKATVLSAGLLSAKEHSAKVLLFVNTVTTTEGSKKQQLDQNRVLMTLTRKDGGWTVSKMDAF